MILDHYYIEDYEGVLYTVVGNRHPPGYIYSYAKYKPSKNKTPWCKKGVCYKRAFRTYSPKAVHDHYYVKLYDPYYDAYIPATPESVIKKIYDPVKRVYEMIVKPQDSIEEMAGYYASILAREANIPLSNIGITGSILPRIHNPLISDIDYVIYGESSSRKVIEVLSEGVVEGFKPFNKTKLYEWCKRLSRELGLEIHHVMKAYRIWRRGLMSNTKEYSITYSLDYVEPYPGVTWKTIGVVRIKARVENTYKTLNYPSRALLKDYMVLSRISGTVIHPIKEVVSFENLFLPLLFEEGNRVIEGILQYSKDLNYSRILIGVKEYRGFIIDADTG